MNEDYNRTYLQVEHHHWWFQARRKAVLRLLERMQWPRDIRLLDIGCSGGAMLQMLQQAGWTDLLGFDLEASGLSLSNQVSPGRILQANAGQLPFRNDSVDAALASDVLEHIQDDGASLRDWLRVVRPGGRLLLFVPAYPQLWSRHDTWNHHYRRYRLPELVQTVTAAGWKVDFSSYWNTFWLPAVAGARLLERLLGPGKAEPAVKMPPAWLNHLMGLPFHLEHLWLRKHSLPMGLSCVVHAHKMDDR